jgi:hypothetical protein
MRKRGAARAQGAAIAITDHCTSTFGMRVSRSRR